MSVKEIREWATKKYGAHSHQEGQVFAALQGLEEWLDHLKRHGVMLEVNLPQVAVVAAAKVPDEETEARVGTVMEVTLPAFGPPDE